MEETARFAALVSAGGPLDELALAVAAHARRGLEPAEQLARLDVIAAGVPVPTPSGLCRHLFVDLGFEGNEEAYYDPRNSFLDRVLDRRLGIPVSLSVLAIEVGRRVGVGLVGVGMPGHFLLCERDDAGSFFDPFGGGRALDPAGCETLFRRLHGPNSRFDGALLQPATNLEITSRMLVNLTRIYFERTDRRALSWVLRLRTLLPDTDPSVTRQLAGVLAARGMFWEAADEYEVLASMQPEREAEHLGTAARLRAGSN